MSPLTSPLPNSVTALTPELLDWRRDLHRHPELGYEEHRTSAFVAEQLRAFGLDAVETGLGETGVVGVLHGADGPAEGEARAIMLRADMDALPMQEENEFEHRSQIDGKMHACGHDGHTTMLLGAAKLLAAERPFKGTVYFCFQPAEEGGAGAAAMLRDGLFARFPSARVFGMHNWPGMPVGAFGVRPGPMLAASDEFRVTLRGRGGHAAKPDRARDPIVAAAHFVSLAQTLVSRGVDPLKPAVVSITTLHGGSAFNVIPDTATLSGTVRSFDDEVHAEIYRGLERLARNVGDLFEMTVELEGPIGHYPPTVNDADAAAFAQDVLTELVGADNVRGDFPPTMGAEDFSFLARVRPACFVFVGNGDSAPLHNPKFDFNDEAAPIGVAYWSKLVQTALPA